jgi:hypothetical protein
VELTLDQARYEALARIKFAGHQSILILSVKGFKSVADRGDV